NCEDFGPHFCDRLAPYLGWQWDDSSFRSRDRVDPGDTVETLRGGRVRIVRDKATGAPHIWGDPDPGSSGQAATDSSAANLAYVAGVNDVIQRVTTNPTQLPAEFTLLQDLPIKPWTREDSLAIGTLELKAEAEAGGQELVAAAAVQKLAASGRGLAGASGVLQDWYFREDPAAPASVPGTTPAHQPDVYPFSA